MRHIPLLFFLAIAVASTNAYSACVNGTLVCGDKRLQGAKVTLWEKDPGFDDKLSEIYTNDKGFFSLSGTEWEAFGIKPYVRIDYECKGKKKKLERVVPAAYVHEGKVPWECFDLGRIYLDKL